MHADRPGDRPRLLYWYRTAPDIALGRSPLDEDAIRTIEEQHPDIEFDWPAILALSEVMTPEDEAPAKPPQREQRQGRRPKGRGESDFARQPQRELRRDDQAQESSGLVEPEGDAEATAIGAPDLETTPSPEPVGAESNRTPAPSHSRTFAPSGLVDQLAGREIAARLRARYDEITARLQDADDSARESLLKRAEALDPDGWDTPEAVLQGVSNADALFEQLKALVAPKP